MPANAAAPHALPAAAPQALKLELVPFATGLNQPLSVTHAGDARLSVGEKAGRIRIVRPDGAVGPALSLDITDRFDASGGEMGLLGLAVPGNEPSRSDSVSEVLGVGSRFGHTRVVE